MVMAGVVDWRRGKSRRDNRLPDRGVRCSHARHRGLGPQHHRRVGRGYCRLCVVDWHWQCRHANLLYVAANAAKMARFHQSFRRSDDAFRCRHRRDIPDHPSRPSDVFLLADPLPQYDARLAAMAQRPDLGFLGNPQLHPFLDPVLVCRPHSRSGHAARSCPHQMAKHDLRRAGARLARFGAALARL